MPTITSKARAIPASRTKRAEQFLLAQAESGTPDANQAFDRSGHSAPRPLAQDLLCSDHDALSQIVQRPDRSIQRFGESPSNSGPRVQVDPHCTPRAARHRLLLASYANRTQSWTLQILRKVKSGKNPIHSGRNRLDWKHCKFYYREFRYRLVRSIEEMAFGKLACSSNR